MTVLAAGRKEWLDYWQNLPPGALLFSPEADEFSTNLQAAVLLSNTMRVLDYGCGYGGITQRLAPFVGTINCWDAAPGMLETANAALRGVPNSRMWNETDGEFDLIIVNSVVQYMDALELKLCLNRWRDLLAPDGRILLSDLILESHRGISDVFSLLQFSIRRGYFFTALSRTLAEKRRYDRAAAAAPLFHVNSDWLESTAAECGMKLQWLPQNLTHFRGRRSALLTRKDNDRHAD